MKNAKKLLDACQQKFPSPRSDQRHSLSIMDDMLVLTVMLGDTYQRFNFYDVDLEKNVDELVRNIGVLMRKSSPKKQPDDIA